VRCVRIATEQEQVYADGTIIQNATTDKDGNIYHGTKIGTQVWFTENLKTTRYNDSIGTQIPTNLSNDNWQVQNGTTGKDGAFEIYNRLEGVYTPINGLDSEEAMKDAYGCLYNWYAVNNAKGLAPDGFLIPTDDDWNTLKNYLISQGTTQGITVGYNYPNDQIINASNVGNALKSVRQVNSPFYKYIKPKDGKRIDASIIDNLPTPISAHNDTTGKQGGIAGEYYHLTNAQVSALHPIQNGSTLPTVAVINVTGTTQGVYADGNVIPVGTALETIVRNMLVTVINPTYTQPSTSITDVSSSLYELGQQVAIEITQTFFVGDSGGRVSEKIYKDGSSVSTTNTFSETLTCDDSTTYYGTTTYAQGPVKNNNLTPPEAYEPGRIGAGTVTS